MRQQARSLTLCALLIVAMGSGHAGAENLDDYWNLGSLGAKGDLVDGRLVIVRVLKNCPSEKRLEKGDVLIEANGTELGKDPVATLGRLLDAAEKTGALALTIERDGTKQEIKVALPKLGTYAGAFSLKNSKVKKHLKTACTFLAKSQQAGGVWHKYRDGATHRGDGITTATVMSALALMAVDAKKYKTPIKSARGFVLSSVRPADLGPAATQSLHRNWPVALTTLFLAEFYGQTGDKAVRKHLGAMLDRLAENQEPTGGWSHFPGFTEGANYKSLSSLTAIALIAQGVASATGMPVDESSTKKGLDYLEGCIDESGGLAYSAVNGATGVQCAGRSCGALLALLMHGRSGARIEKLQAYVLAHFTDVLESHPAPLTGVFLATMLAGWMRSSDDDALAGLHDKLAEHLVPFVTLARHPEGYFLAQPSSETRSVGSAQGKPNADRSVHDPYWATAILVMLQTTTKPKLICLGGKARKR